MVFALESLSFGGIFCVDVIGNVGGLSLFWKKGIDLEGSFFFFFLIQMLIACIVYSELASKVWMLLLVYGLRRLPTGMAFGN